MRTYLEQAATRALTPTGGFLRGFAYSLNPYVGCAFGDSGGCPFCYVRALPVARTRNAAWGTWVIAKTNLPELLERELAALERSGKLGDAAIFMSSATDPYQGFERRAQITRRAIELFVRHPPRRVVIQTRSPLIERDIGIIARLGPRAIASITLETDDDEVRRGGPPTPPSASPRAAASGGGGGGG